MRNENVILALVGLKSTPTCISIVYGGDVIRQLLEDEDIICQQKGRVLCNKSYLKVSDINILSGVRGLLGGWTAYVQYQHSYFYLWVLE